MRAEGIKVTAEQCRNKLKDIKRQWREVFGHNNVTGNEPKTCLFFRIWMEFMGQRLGQDPGLPFRV